MMEKLNVASRGEVKAERKRTPMSVPVRKLAAPEIPGYHLYWFPSTPDWLERGLNAGYEFVDSRDVKLNPTTLGGDSAISGSTDMGSRVSVVAGKELGTDGQPIRFILMKQRLEWWEEDQKLVEAENEKVASALRGGLIGAGQDSAGDTGMRYIKKDMTKIPDLFTPKRKKA